MNKIKLWWIGTFKVISIEQANEMGLTWKRNVYGDEINHSNCRSIWLDKNGDSYRVAELVVTAKDNIMYVAELEEQISTLKSTCIELSKRVVYTEKEKNDYWEIDCECGFVGLSMFASGGSQIADTGDYGACYCPCCGETLD